MLTKIVIHQESLTERRNLLRQRAHSGEQVDHPNHLLIVSLEIFQIYHRSLYFVTKRNQLNSSPLHAPSPTRVSVQI